MSQPVVLITGASRGIGKAIAVALGAEYLSDLDGVACAFLLSFLPDRPVSAFLAESSANGLGNGLVSTLGGLALADFADENCSIRP